MSAADATAAPAALSLGARVPDFTASDSAGKPWRLRDRSGRKLVLYFYPRDMTPGCTLESQDFRDLQGAFHKANTDIAGVSRDSCSSHVKFIAKEKLGFDLLSDADEALCRLFDVIRDKNMYGKKVRGIERSTFLIDGAGILVREWRKVKVEGHAEAVLEAARAG